MKAFRRILLAVAILLAVVGITISLLPYDVIVRAPAFAGQTGLTAEVSCKAPVIDLVTDEPDDAWMNYAPNEGIVFESTERAGGEYCQKTMQARGTFGLILILAGVCFAAAAVVGGRLRPGPEAAVPTDGPEAPAHRQPANPPGGATPGS